MFVLPQSLPRYLTPFILLFTLFTFAYSIATLVYVRELHNALPHTPCSKVTPGLREYLRIGGWVVVVGMVVVMVMVIAMDDGDVDGDGDGDSGGCGVVPSAGTYRK